MEGLPGLAHLHLPLGCAETKVPQPCPWGGIQKPGVKTGNLHFSLSLVDSEEQPSLRNAAGGQPARALESDKAEFKSNFCYCGRGPLRGFSKPQFAHP